MTTEAIIANTKQMIDDLKTVCANFGLGNASSEYKIITEIFLYKFLNDKFIYEVQQADEELKNSENVEQALNIMSEDDYEMLMMLLPPATAKLKKKKGSNEFYTDMWYYLCKNRKMVSGHLCDYKKHIRQDEINAEVIQLVKYVFCGENDMKDQILKKLGSDDSLSELLQEKERLTKEHEKLDSKKSKQLRRINELDIDDELYDDLMKTYRAGVQEINEQIAIIENQMYQNDLSIENAQGENLSAEVYKRIIDEMLDHIDDMPDSDKKLMMNLLIEKVEIYEEKQKDGRWVKSVQFKIPLNVDGKLVDTMFFDDEDTENSLSNEKHVETCVLLSKLG